MNYTFDFVLVILQIPFWNYNLLCNLCWKRLYLILHVRIFLQSYLLFMLHLKLVLVYADFKCVCHLPLVTV